MAEQSKLPRGGKKYRRIPKMKNFYKLQFGLTDRNKKRRLRRHIRSFPDDTQARSIWRERYEK